MENCESVVLENTCRRNNLQNFMKNLNIQWKQKRFCDFTLKAKDGGSFLVHRIVISAASLFFETMFNSKFSDSRSSEIELVKVSSDILEKIIEFMYGEEILIEEEKSCELLDAALFLGLYDLVDGCTKVLMKTVKKQNLFELLHYAESYVNMHGEKLARECLKLIFEDIQEVMKTINFHRLSIESMKILISIERDDCYKEENLCSAIIEWISFDKDKREQYTSLLLNGICFKKISCEFLSKIFNDNNNPIRKNVDFLEKMFEIQKQNIESQVMIGNKSKPISLNQDQTKNLSTPSSGNMFAVFENRLDKLDPYNIGLSKFITNVDRIDFGYTDFKNQGVFICGGKSNFNSNTVLGTCKYFSFSTNKWNSLPPMSVSRCGHGAITINDEIYICSGYDCSSVEIFNLNMIFWRSGPDLKTKMGRFGLCTLDLCIYAIGHGNFQRLDLRESKWSDLTNITEVIDFFDSCAAIGYNNSIYTFNEEGCYEFDIRQNEYIGRKENIETNLNDPYVCMLGNEVYLMHSNHHLIRFNCEDFSTVKNYEFSDGGSQWALFCIN